MAIRWITGRGVLCAVLVILVEIPCSVSFTKLPFKSDCFVPGGFVGRALRKNAGCCTGRALYVRNHVGKLYSKLEDDLGNVFGGIGREVGKSIDWFFDTSHLQGAKAWRLQEVAGEADSIRWRERKDALSDAVQDQVQAARLTGQAEIAELEGKFGNFFSDGQPDSYSMTDDDLGTALTERLGELANGLASPLGSADGLTGQELAQLCFKKYGLYHDMAIKCDKLQLVSDKKLVSLNIYYSYVGQINPKFQYSETEYMMKLDALANLVNQWQQQEYVRQFFKEKPTAYRGLPSRPRWDTAVSIRLYKSPTWNEELVGDWFMV